MAAHGSDFSAERMAEDLAYICENKANSRHIRKVGPGAASRSERLRRLRPNAGDRVRGNYTLESAGRRFKAKFNHEAGGGIDIVEIAALHSKEIGLVYRARNLADAERFYLLPQLSAAVRAHAA